MKILFEENIISWTSISSFDSPGLGLINYGLGITEKGIIVLFGGLIDTSEKICSIRRRTLTTVNETWILNMSHPSLEFIAYNWVNNDIGGYSKIVSLGGELLCVFNTKFKNEMRILNMDLMQSFDPVIENAPENLKRNAFGIAGKGDLDFIIYGGYDESQNSVSPLTPLNIFYQLSFSSRDINQLDSKITNGIDISMLVIILVISFIIFIVGALFIYKKYEKKLVLKHLKQKELIMHDINIAMENSKKEAKSRMKNIDADSNFTATLALPGQKTFSIPAYKKALYGKDFREEKILARGGMGEISTGMLLDTKLIGLNMGDEKCIIKKPLKTNYIEGFLQELAIHEFFSDIKYFARLICFTQEPESIVLKYYLLGSLKNLLYNENKNPEIQDIQYNFSLSLFLLQKITWSLGFMHLKGFIHNDVKPDNVLLDKDDKEPLFPVITDFGIVFVMNSATSVNQMKTRNIVGATLAYASPETIHCLLKKEKEFIPTFKCDVYSIGIMGLEMFIKQDPWDNKFSKEKVVQGVRPNLYISHPNQKIKEKIMTLLKSCWEENPNNRPIMKNVHDCLMTIS